MRYTFLIIVAAFLLVACAPITEKPIACTMEAKLCPDGSAVGRAGPNCEFAPCPVQNNTNLEQNSTQNWGEPGPGGITKDCMELFDPINQRNFWRCPETRYTVTYKGEDIACTKEYNPVCVWHNENVQCFAYPCAITVGNACEAQTIANAAYYTKGECPNSVSYIAIPPGTITLEKDADTSGTYGPECTDKAYWAENADWIVDGTVVGIKAEQLGERTKRTSTLRLDKYVKGLPVADTMAFSVISGYSTSNDFEPFFEQGAAVRMYLIDAYRVTGYEEYKGVFGTVCGGYEVLEGVKKQAIDCTYPRPDACTMDYAPVCGQLILNTGEVTTQTYSNGCVACNAMKVVSYTQGACA